LHRFDTDHECDRRTDGQTDGRTDGRPDDGKDARSILLSRVKLILMTSDCGIWCTE